MELDIGAGVSVISEETYKKHFSGTPLMQSNTRVRAYTGHPLKVHGQLLAHLKYQDQSADVPLLHVEGSGPSLFGRYWLSRRRLGWTKICNIRVSETDLPQGVARPVPYALQEAVEAEYNRLEDRKVFRKVSGIDRELNICRIHVEEYHEPVFALSSRLFCHL